MQPLFFPVVALVALIGVRLLGIRLGWWRVLLVAWLGLATAGFALTAVGFRDFHGGGLALVISFGLLAMLAWAGIFELLGRSRPEPTRRPLTNPLKAIRSGLPVAAATWRSPRSPCARGSRGSGGGAPRTAGPELWLAPSTPTPSRQPGPHR